jgi:hypothetical protein
MTTREFIKAVTAYLEGRATSWQKFLVDDYFDSFHFEINILDLYHDAEADVIGERMKKNINDRLDLLDSV